MQIFSHFFNVPISVIRMKSPCVIVHKQVKMLSHVVNITVHSVRITWCKLWQQFGWPLLNWNAEGCISYVCHMSISKVQIYTLLYVGYWLKETVSKCLNYLGYGWSPNICLHTSAIVRSLLTTWSTIVAYLFHLICASVLSLFCLFLCPSWILTLLLPLVCWPWSFSGCSSTVRICNSCVFLSVYICFPIEGSWHAPLSTFRALVYNWLIYTLFINENQDSPAQFMVNLQKVY